MMPSFVLSYTFCRIDGFKVEWFVEVDEWASPGKVLEVVGHE
jgi:hypothetical protein